MSFIENDDFVEEVVDTFAGLVASRFGLAKGQHWKE